VSSRERVLVVDEISDTAEVLQAVLEPRGVTVNRICRLSQSDYPTVENRPAVVVYDADTIAAGAFAAGGNWQGVPQIIIGTIRAAHADRPESDRGESNRGVSAKRESAVPNVARRYLQKPFQFAELLQAIEALIKPRAA
jgi:CheY-like chemotaxis protein